MRSVLLVLALAGTTLAGCSEPPSAPAEILIESAPPEEVRSGDESAPATAVFEASAKTRGHIAGIVVDEAIRPIAGAVVRLPGMNLERPTERDGSFGFVDLYPGPYYLTVEAAGYRSADAMLEVAPDEFTRAKVILTAIPPPEPYHTTQAFEGFAEMTTDPFLGYAVLCTECDFDFYIDRAGLHTVILEAVGDPPAEGDGFWHEFGPYGGNYGSRASSGTNTGPLRVELRDEDLGDGNRFELRLDPESFPAPQTSKRFRAYVTAFYNEGPPVGWSIVDGDT